MKLRTVFSAADVQQPTGATSAALASTGNGKTSGGPTTEKNM
jgi:hypothetical protein